VFFFFLNQFFKVIYNTVFIEIPDKPWPRFACRRPHCKNLRQLWPLKCSAFSKETKCCICRKWETFPGMQTTSLSDFYRKRVKEVSFGRIMSLFRFRHSDLSLCMISALLGTPGPVSVISLFFLLLLLLSLSLLLFQQRIGRKCAEAAFVPAG